MASFTLPAAHLRSMTDDLVEGIRIGEKPALNVRIGAGCDQPFPEMNRRDVFNLGFLLQRCGTVAVDSHDDELGWVSQYPLLDHSEIGTKFMHRVAVTSAS